MAKSTICKEEKQNQIQKQFQKVSEMGDSYTEGSAVDRALRQGRKNRKSRKETETPRYAGLPPGVEPK